VGQNGLGLNRPHHHNQIVQEVLYSNYLNSTEDDILCAEHYDKSNNDSEEGDQIQHVKHGVNSILSIPIALSQFQ